MSAPLTVEDMDRLRHMLGVETRYPPSRWGFRNYYSVGNDEDLASMNRLAGCGWVEHVRDSFWIATLKGCRAAGLPLSVAEAVVAGGPRRRSHA